VTISSESNTAGPFAGNGSTKAFPFAFKVFSTSELSLEKTSAAGVVTPLVFASDFGVLLNADQDAAPGGTITYPLTGAALAVGETLIVSTDLPYTQLTDITNAGGFLPQVVEDALDRNVRLMQQQNARTARSVRAPLGELMANLPPAAERANMLLTFDDDGDPVAVAAAAQSATQLAIDFASAASGKGAALVGSNDAGGYYWGDDAEEILQELANPIGSFADGVHLLKYVTPSEWPAISNNTSTFDCAAAFTAALNAIKTRGGGTLILPYGAVAVSTVPFEFNTALKPTVNIRGQGTMASFVKKRGATATAVFAFTVDALGNGVYATFSDFSIVGNGACNGITATLLARYQTRNLRITMCVVAFDAIGSLIGDHYNPAFEGNQIGYRSRVSGIIYPNLITFHGGDLLNNTVYGADIGDAMNVFFNATDIELNGTTGNTSTGGVIIRSTCGTATLYANIAFNGAWVEGNKGGPQIQVEDAVNLCLSMTDVPFTLSPNNKSLTVGAIRSLIIDNCSNTTFGYEYNIGAAQSVMIRGGSSWMINNAALQWSYEGVILGGVLVKKRVSGASLGTYTQNAERHNSGTSSVSAPTATATTLFTVSGAGPRIINVFACLGGAGAGYMSNARCGWDGTNLVRMGGENAANLTLTASGANVQVTQTSGITQSVFYTSDVIGS